MVIAWKAGIWAARSLCPSGGRPIGPTRCRCGPDRSRSKGALLSFSRGISVDFLIFLFLICLIIGRSRSTGGLLSSSLGISVGFFNFLIFNMFIYWSKS